ncbi:MAG: ATP-binding protein [Candidatus Poribacteria bacterium]
MARPSVADAVSYLTGDDADSFTSHPNHWVARVEVLSQNAGLGAAFHAHNTEGISLQTEMEVGLYRIAHTALTNVVRHANARNVAVVMQAQRVNDGCRVSLLIEDDGVGFDAEAAAEGPVEGRFGILSMQERARLMGGEVTVDSAPGEGASVLIEVVSRI